IINLKM
ncbi:hypothetical protein ACTA71_004310, partial [Dictyostelium dimigraforme]